MSQHTLVRYIQFGLPVLLFIFFAVFMYLAVQPPYGPVSRQAVRVSANAPYPPTESYHQFSVVGWPVFVSHTLYTDPHKYGRTVYDIKRHVEFGDSLIPSRVRNHLQGTTIWVEKVPDARYAGRFFHRNYDNPHANPEKRGNIELNFANNIEHARKVLAGVFVHEVAHAYHAKLSPSQKQQILKHYNNAVANRRFKTRDLRNDYVSTDYALTNEWEYFAELSALYLMADHGARRTFNKLREIDPNGTAYVMSLWQ